MADQNGQFGAYNVDVCLCIDKTGSMEPIINTVKTNALNLYRDVLDSLEKKGKHVSQFRIRVIWFGDYLSDADPILVSDFLKMPEYLSNEVKVTMSDDECDVYDQMRKQLVIDLNGREIDAKNAAALSNKLCQMANGAVYTGDREAVRFHDRKLDALEDLMEAANGQPTLVAYWFKHDLQRIQERFPEARELKTSEDIHAWNNGRIPMALIHPASAGHGLNLQAGGSSLIWFGLTWSLELYQQTNARLWRQGQKADTVVIQHIITRDTMDEMIMTALDQKDKTQTALMEAVRAQLMKPAHKPKRGTAI